MAIKFDDYKVGDEIPAIAKDKITHLQLVRYAGASGDFNPIHHDNEYAKGFGLPGTIAHGMLVMGMLGQLVSSWAGVKQVKSFGVAFKAMTLPGDELKLTGTVKKVKPEDKTLVVAVAATDAKGEVKVGGEAVIQAE